MADLAILVVSRRREDESEEPVLVTKGVLRVAARFIGDPVDRRNRLTDGRLEVARMIGDDSDARAAHLGLIELANTLCRPVEPVCTACPLQKLLPESRRSAAAAAAVLTGLSAASEVQSERLRHRAPARCRVAAIRFQARPLAGLHGRRLRRASPAVRRLGRGAARSAGRVEVRGGTGLLPRAAGLLR